MPDYPVAAKPTKKIFDAFNSSATGHQRAENLLSGSTSWRNSRNLKLDEQFSSGTGGGKRVWDTVGAGSIEFDEQRKATIINGELKQSISKSQPNQRSIFENLPVSKNAGRPSKRIKLDGEASTEPILTSKSTSVSKGTKVYSSTTSMPPEPSPSDLLSPIDPNSNFSPISSPTVSLEEDESDLRKRSPQIFANITVYINGSTAPTISDHKLKHMLREHGARMSIALGRKTVTHVIIGRPNSAGGGGGGLSGSKIEKEIAASRGAIKFVSVEWALESITAGKRLPESRFEALKLAPKGVGNIASLFGRKKGHMPD